jgi:hypothetical protein
MPSRCQLLHTSHQVTIAVGSRFYDYRRDQLRHAPTDAVGET